MQKTKKLSRHLAQIKDFSTDGCTGSPDFDFTDCCVEHDYLYGSSLPISRKDADLSLKRCIEAKGRPGLARIYYWGVRLLGGPHWKERHYEKDTTV
jgi:hypothetical protein